MLEARAVGHRCCTSGRRVGKHALITAVFNSIVNQIAGSTYVPRFGN